LINLIGNIACDTNESGHIYKDYFRTNLLYILHRLIYEYEISNKVDKDIYDINSNIQNKIRLVINGETYTNKQTNFEKIRSEYNDIFINIKKVLEDDVLKNYDSNNNKDYLNLNEFTYKNTKFHENEPEMFSYTGMETNGVLTPPILIHTWMLSQIFKPLERDIFNYRNVFYDPNGATLIEANIDKIKKQTLYANLQKIFNDKHKAIRLKNIFFKAITNCYDGKTTFSVNFISATKKALNNSELLKIITDNKFYYFTNNINFVKSLNPILIPSKDTTTQISNNINNINDDLKPTAIDTTTSPNIQLTSNLNKLLICNDTNIANLIQSLKYYKDTDLNILYSELLKNNTTFNNSPVFSYTYSLKYFEGNDPNDFNKIPADLYCHYLFSIEELETKTCPSGHFYNPNVKECEKIIEPPPPQENKSQMDDEEINIPDLKNIMNIFLQIIIVVVVLYLIYIVYDMFGEFILSTINYIFVNFNHIKQGVNFKLMDLLSGTKISDKLDVESKKLNSKIDLLQSELDKLIKKDTAAIEYNKEVENEKKKKAKAEEPE
jgi:hypothetical protein